MEAAAQTSAVEEQPEIVEVECDHCGAPIETTEPGPVLCGPCGRYFDWVDSKIDEAKEGGL